MLDFGADCGDGLTERNAAGVHRVQETGLPLRVAEVGFLPADARVNFRDNFGEVAEFFGALSATSGGEAGQPGHRAGLLQNVGLQGDDLVAEDSLFLVIEVKANAGGLGVGECFRGVWVRAAGTDLKVGGNFRDGRAIGFEAGGKCALCVVFRHLP